MAFDLRARLAARKKKGSERLQHCRALTDSINKADYKPKLELPAKAVAGRISAKLFYRETKSKNKNDSTLFRHYFLGAIPVGFMHVYQVKEVKPYVFYINMRESKAFWTEEKAHRWLKRRLEDFP